MGKCISIDINNNNDAYINGYAEVDGGNSPAVSKNDIPYLIGNCCYICKPNTEFTRLWYSSMIHLMNLSLDKLKMHPATKPDDCYERIGGRYPITWTGMLGDIFHQVCLLHKDKILKSVPICNVKDGYR